jgi:hypothetical protein
MEYIDALVFLLFTTGTISSMYLFVLRKERLCQLFSFFTVIFFVMWIYTLFFI